MTRIEKAIELHKRHSRISFKILHETDTEVTVRVSQARNPNGNYASAERLREIVHELYAMDPFFKKSLKVHAVPYKVPPSHIVTPEWVQGKMNETGIGLKGLVEDLGISKADMSATINGHKEMGVRTQGLFYYYFLSKQLQGKKRKTGA